MDSDFWFSIYLFNEELMTYHDLVQNIEMYFESFEDMYEFLMKIQDL